MSKPNSVVESTLYTLYILYTTQSSVLKLNIYLLKFLTQWVFPMRRKSLSGSFLDLYVSSSLFFFFFYYYFCSFSSYMHTKYVILCGTKFFEEIKRKENIQNTRDFCVWLYIFLKDFAHISKMRINRRFRLGNGKWLTNHIT